MEYFTHITYALSRESAKEKHAEFAALYACAHLTFSLDFLAFDALFSNSQKNSRTTYKVLKY